MKFKITLNKLKSLSLASLLMLSALVYGQNNGPALEMATGAGNPTVVGPVNTTTINFQNNTNNPTGTTFATYNPNLAATYTISNPRYTNVMTIGQTTTGTAPIFDLMNAQGSPADANFTSAGSAAGTGIAVGTNRAVRMYVLTSPLRLAALATNGTYAMADLTITFNRPVNNPVIHIGALGGTSSSTPTLGFAGRFDLISSNIPLANLSMTRLSGNSATGFQTTGLSISNGAATFTSTGANSGSGSVRINGTGITTLTFTIFIKGDGANAATTAWAASNTDTGTGEAITVGLSVAESDIQLTKTISNSSAAVGSNVTFVVTASNNGASNNANVNITDLLPSGYTLVGIPTVSSGTYTTGTGVWNIPLLDAGASATLTIIGTVRTTGNYSNTATLTSSTLLDSKSFNNTASASRLTDSDGDGVFDNNDLDDDNDGILDTAEKGTCGTTGSITSVTGYKAGVYDGVPGVDAWTEMNASTTFPTASFNQIATFDYNEFAATQNAFGLNFEAAGNVSGTNPDVTNYQGIPLSPPNHEYAVAFSKIINADEVGTYQYTLTNADNHVFVYKNGVKVASRQNVFSSTIPVANFVTIAVALGDRIDIVLVEEDLNNTYVIMSATKTVGQCLRDTDGDGIPNHLDLDSDGDGCSDAFEGGANITNSQLVTAGGTVSGGSTAVNQNLCETGTCVNASGVPQFATLPTNYNNSTGQAIGQSQDNSKNDCLDTDGDGVPDYQDVDNDNDGIYDTAECGVTQVNNTPFSLANGASQTLTAPAADFGYFFDVYTLDNSFNLIINGTPLIQGNTNELQFEAGTANFPINVRFADGTAYGTGTPIIWSMTGTAANPLIRIIINKNGTVTLFGSKTSGGPLFLLEVYNGSTLNTVPWYSNSANTIILSQQVSGQTLITGNGTGYKLASCDTDGDGIPNYLDLDSDNDGCPDAVEGNADITSLQLVSAGGILRGGNGTNPVTTPTSGYYNQSVLLNLCATATCVNAQGLPQFATLPTGYSNSAGQGIGDSQNALINLCYCYKKPVLNAGTTVPVQHGITALNRAGSGTAQWPVVRQSAWTVLEANSKGFVVNRVEFFDHDNNAATPTRPVGIQAAEFVEGMMVYDTVANCLKIYNGTFWNCYSTQTCPQ